MNDSELDTLLLACGTPVRPPQGFQRDVWCRIETAEFAGWKVRLDQALDRLFGIIALPPVAVATCTVMVLAGAWFGLKTASPDAPNEIAYVQSISPFAHQNR